MVMPSSRMPSCLCRMRVFVMKSQLSEPRPHTDVGEGTTTEYIASRRRMVCAKHASCDDATYVTQTIIYFLKQWTRISARAAVCEVLKVLDRDPSQKIVVNFKVARTSTGTS